MSKGRKFLSAGLREKNPSQPDKSLMRALYQFIRVDASTVFQLERPLCQMENIQHGSGILRLYLADINLRVLVCQSF